MRPTEAGSVPDGRAAEIAARIRRLGEGRGGILIIEGMPETGKSRLAGEARALAESAGIRVLSGAGERVRRTVPFGALRRALESGTGSVADAGIVRTLSESADQRFWLFPALGDQLRRASLEAPLLVIVDELQWCDTGTLLALRALAPRLSSDAILWLIVVRAGVPGPAVRATVGHLARSSMFSANHHGKGRPT
ncbi:ATP-binding protein [Actinocorallia longicatena]|uniref:Orc1-like AAA ATPase domain-containing protein n=1 Tax=Actinocorallia longicatena TaxID=111803 RepID=A0ABP6QDW5_9ACTN